MKIEDGQADAACCRSLPWWENEICCEHQSHPSSTTPASQLSPTPLSRCLLCSRGFLVVVHSTTPLGCMHIVQCEPSHMLFRACHRAHCPGVAFCLLRQSLPPWANVPAWCSVASCSAVVSIGPWLRGGGERIVMSDICTYAILCRICTWGGCQI